MTDRPLVFSGPMVLALLAGRKVQTRRLLDPQPLPDRRPTHFVLVGTCRRTGRYCWEAHDQIGPMGGAFPGPPGCAYTVARRDRIWVREAWRAGTGLDDLSPTQLVPGEPRAYEADGEQLICLGTEAVPYLPDEFGRRRASIHMPRWASRLTLIVSDVRIQRLRDISEEDAFAEGVCSFVESLDRPGSWEGMDDVDRKIMVATAYRDGRDAYRHLWEHLHGADTWAKNPWIVAISFSVERGNIDALAAPERERFIA